MYIYLFQAWVLSQPTEQCGWCRWKGFALLDCAEEQWISKLVPSLTVKIHEPIYNYGLHFVEEQHKCHFTGPRHIKTKNFTSYSFSFKMFIVSNIFWLFFFFSSFHIYKNGWRTNVLFICLQNKRYIYINTFDSQRRYKTENYSSAPSIM
jgi:hypothetical protein